MNSRIAGAVLWTAVLGCGSVAAQQFDPWGAPAPVDPYQLPPLDPYEAQPVDPYGAQPIDPYGQPPSDVPSEQPNAQASPFPGAVPESAQPAPPVRIENRVAAFSGLDKITGRITTFDAYVDETVQFGALQVTPRACFTAPPEETPKTDTFVEIDEITLDRDIRRIFTGWMFADSPGLNAVEHPVYDVWLIDCRSDSEVPPPAE